MNNRPTQDFVAKPYTVDDFLNELVQAFKDVVREEQYNDELTRDIMRERLSALATERLPVTHKLEVVCDQTNNTPEMVDRGEFAVGATLLTGVETHVWTIKGDTNGIRVIKYNGEGGRAYVCL